MVCIRYIINGISKKKRQKTKRGGSEEESESTCSELLLFRMVSLIDIPGVLALANWIWGGSGGADGDVDGDGDDAAERCLGEFPFFGSACFGQLLTKALGVAIILGSCLNKIPIMINMVRAQSASGISRNSLYGEMIVYANCTFYGILWNHPFTAFGENVSLLLQNAVLVVIAWRYTNAAGGSATKVSPGEKIAVVTGFALYSVAVLNFLPEHLRYLLMSSTYPVMLYARGSQVLETYQVKNTGNLSIATTTLNLVGAMIRVGKIILELCGSLTLSPPPFLSSFFSLTFYF